MAVIIQTLLITLIFSIQYSNRRVIAKPLEEYTNTARFQCPNQSICSCQYLLHNYEIECPPFMGGLEMPKIILKVQPGESVQIECNEMNDSVYTQLPPMNIGQIKIVQFRRCPLPGSGTSLYRIMEHLGMKKIQTLSFSSYGATTGVTLGRQHLSGFTDLKRLMLSGIGLSKLPEDLFYDVRNLTWLDLRANKVHLPANIFANLTKLEYLELGHNNLKQLELGVFRSQNRLKSLNLWGNDLQNLSKNVFIGLSSIDELDISSNNIEQLQPDVFELLTNLTNINLSANNFTSLPIGLFDTNKNLSRIRLMDNRIPLKVLPDGMLANLPVLEDVHIKCDLEIIPENMFENSVNIKNLSLALNRLHKLPGNLFVNQTNVLDMDLSNNQLEELHDGLFRTTRSMLVLKLSQNKISKISGTIFRELHNLQELYLDNNAIQTINSQAFSTNKYLQNLQLNDNHLSFVNNDQGEMTYDIDAGSVFQYLENIHIINLRNNSIMDILMDWTSNNLNLKELDLSYNNITFIKYTDIIFLSQQIIVNLTHNAIKEIDFHKLELIVSEDSIVNSKKSVKILLDNNPLRCDCHIMHFIQFLQKREKRLPKYLDIIIDDMQCSEPPKMISKLIKHVQPKELTCPLDSPNSAIRRCPNNCTCDVRTADKALIVNCSNANLDQVPILPNPIDMGLNFTELYIENNNIRELPSIINHTGYMYVSEIHAKGNNISNLYSTNIPRQLVVLELMNNNLQTINASVFEMLNKTNRLERLLLSQNPWICDCSAKDFLTYAKVHFQQISDLKEVACTNGQQFIGIGDLCPENEVVIIAISIIIALFGLLLGILAALYYKYQQEVKVWLYAHKLCLWFVTEEELDKDKKYDAFVSYSHKDADLISEHMIPQLENIPNGFKLCLHDRDWIAGEFITESIARSVEDSRRTIVILSPNFLESIWGKMEFQVAHKNALTEGRARVIIVIYGDIGNIENLDPALKSYLKTNTYVKWGDPWFWNKLRYAMPHSKYPSTNGFKTKRLLKNPIRSSVDDKLELIKPIPVTPPMTTPPSELAGQKFQNGLNGHVNGAFIINTNAKQSDV